MSASRHAIEAGLLSYEQKLENLRSYVRELTARVAGHGTDRAHVEEDLLEAEHNIAYYEGEVARLRGELGGGRAALRHRRARSAPPCPGTSIRQSARYSSARSAWRPASSSARACCRAGETTDTRGEEHPPTAPAPPAVADPLAPDA